MSRPSPRWRHPYDFRATRPLFVDAWPAAWTALAPPHTLVGLDRAETRALGANTLGCHALFGDASPVPLAGLLARLDAAVARQGGDCFVRLTSRSPKDSLRALRLGLRVADGRQALALFLEASQRCAHDLRMSLDCAIPLAIVVRPWLRFEARQEWRVFMRNHAWAGASARVGLGAADRPWLERRAAALRPHLFGLVTTLARASPTTDVAFDVIVSDEPNGADDPVVLLDANPLGPLTDLGWFASIGTLDGGLRMGPSRL